MSDKIYRIDLHNHTRYSNLRLRDALAKPSDLIDYAIEIGLKGVSITDHEFIGGHIKANQHALKIKESHPDFKVILGNEIYLVNERPSDEHYHFVLNAKNFRGHYQLRRLSTLAWLNSYNRKGLTRVDTLKSELEMIVQAEPGNLIASTACIGGELGKLILKLTSAEKVGDKETAASAHNEIVSFLVWCKDLFGDDFYLEVQPGISTEQIIVNKRMVSIAKAFDIKMIPTSDGHYLKKEDRYVHKAFLNSENSEREVDAFYQDAYLHTNEEMIEKFKKSDYDESFVLKMFENTMEIYDKIELYSLAHSQQIPLVPVKNYPKPLSRQGDYFESHYPVLSSMFISNDKIERYWVNECIKKLNDIDKNNETYLSELEEEAIVKRTIGEKLNTNLFAYPVTLQHYIDLIWKCGSPVGVGRGSACSALNHYALGITQLDPIEYNFPFFRYLNKERIELPDIDIDVAPSKVQLIVSEIKKERSKNFREDLKLTDIEIENLGANYVCTFGTETSKSAVQTGCRGYRSEDYPMGIDVDTSQYLSSLIPVERGFVWSISDTYYGNEEKDRKAVVPFKTEIDQYPGLLEILLGIEGCISRRGRHASGVLFLNEDPYEFNAFMKTPSGEVVTQYDLHDAEWAGSTKFDILVTEAMDKEAQAIKFLQEDGIFEKDLSLREVYNKYLHPDVLPLDDKKIWDVIQRSAVLDLFQFDSDIGRQGTKKVKPTNMQELSATNGLIRLMTTEKGQETWMDKYVRYKNNREQYFAEVENKYHLTSDELVSFGKYVGETYGIGISQEQLMKVLMDDKICHFTLKESNDARKIVGKKQLARIPELKDKIYNQSPNKNVADYVWDFIVGPQVGYAFSEIHSMSYSFIGFQMAYIATKWNPIYWNTACLVVNSGSLEDEEIETVVSIYEKESPNAFYEDLPDRSGKKKKEKSTDYSKVAKAIGMIKKEGIEVSLVNINTSDYGFKPDVDNNRILYGLKGLTGINGDTIEKIMCGRPYIGIKDFMSRCPLGKTAMINLIKAGAFDEIDKSFNDRRKIMAYYIMNNCDMKKRLTMQNFNGLIQHNLVPKDFELEVRIFNFNKYLKNFKYGTYYVLDERAISFFDKFLNEFIDEVEIIDGVSHIQQTVWDKIYKSFMNNVKESWLVPNKDEILLSYNKMLFVETWKKYAAGTNSKWEMDAMSFYHGPHELKDVNINQYGIWRYNEIPVEEIDYYFKRGGHEIPIYKLYRIMGTVISKNDSRHSISLLTPEGVVNVKMSNDYYAMFKKQVSQINPDGTKTVVEKSWFRKGEKLVCQGFRRGDDFVLKNYKSTGMHELYHIDSVIGNEIVLRHERFTPTGSLEEDDYE